MEWVALILAVIGCVFCTFWIKNPRNKRDRVYGIFSFCGSIVLLTVSILLISYNNDILFFSQKAEYKNVTIDIPQNTEKSSILYFFNDNINNNITSNVVEDLLGQNYQENSSSGSYSMRYSTSEYTLNGVASEYIFVHFNKQGERGKIRSITWQYENPDKQLYNELLEYLTEILGKPIKQEVSSRGKITAEWIGFHLEYNSYRISFGRVFN